MRSDDQGRPLVPLWWVAAAAAATLALCLLVWGWPR